MDAKKKDKLATAVIYILVGIVVLILAGILVWYSEKISVE